MNFEEWFKANYLAVGGAPLVAKAAWEAATKLATQDAARKAAEQSKRYACKKMRGVCKGIADSILRGAQ